MELKKATTARLRDLGLDERWLQDRIEEDPAILGIGDVNIVRREKTQPSGGRIDSSCTTRIVSFDARSR